MKNLSFERMPQYCFSSNRQFKDGECHMERLYSLSVLLLIRKGILRFTENGVPVELAAGEYYIQQAGLYQQGPVPSDSPNYYFIHFRGTFCTAGALPIRGKFDIDKIQPIIHQLELLGNVGERLEYECLFYQLLCALKNQIPQKTTAERLRTYILEHFSENISLDDLTKISLLSKNQTINIFKDTYSSTPHKFLVDFRLQKAGELILATDMSINEICFQVGFSEYSGFYKSFFGKYGTSPQDYRNKHSKGALPDSVYFIP